MHVNPGVGEIELQGLIFWLRGKKQGENSATDEKKIVKNIPGFYVILRGFFVNICLHLINFFYRKTGKK